MIYQLNNETHWELSPELMRKLIELVDNHIEAGFNWEMPNGPIHIELSNFRSALECELYRMRDSAKVSPSTDNLDLTS